MKVFILFMSMMIILSCNNNNVNSEIDKLSNSIEENTKRANELSTPLFKRDSAKVDYEFKMKKSDNNDSSILEVMEEAQR